LYIVKPRTELTEELLSGFSQARLVALALEQSSTILEQSSAIREHSEMLLLLLEQNDQLKQEIHRLKNPPSSGGKAATTPPDWAKANTPLASVRKPRKKRDGSFVRTRQKATQEVLYACKNCPDCGRQLSGGTESSRRQIIELPEIPVSIIDYITIACYCGVCRKRCYPKVDLGAIAVGESRFGQRIHALVADLRQSCRLPVRQISALISSLCHIHVSTGEVNRMLRTVAARGNDTYNGLLKELHNSPFVHGDETGWRENGQNGYLWNYSTPTICYFTYPKTRAGHVVIDVLGNDYLGVLVSDFYGGYNTHMGLHQRCWVHLLRDVHELCRKFPTPGVLAWAKNLRDIYDRAKAYTHPTRRERARARVGFQTELVVLASLYAKTLLPQNTLCKRLLQFESEMFTFVEYPLVPSENNAAERSIRPRVIARKISGGTRSASGTKTMEVLSSLFATWKLRGQDTLLACRAMLATANPQPIPAPT
jgi:transposase